MGGIWPKKKSAGRRSIIEGTVHRQHRARRGGAVELVRRGGDRRVRQLLPRPELVLPALLRARQRRRGLELLQPFNLLDAVRRVVEAVHL